MISKLIEFEIEIVIIEDKYLSLFHQLDSKVLVQKISACNEFIKPVTDTLSFDLFPANQFSRIPHVEFSL